MNRYYCLLLSFLILSGVNTCAAQIVDTNKVVHELNRCWRVVSHEVSPIYGLEDEEIKRYSKQRICFRADSISMFNSILMAPKYSIKKLNAEDYARKNFDCSRMSLAIIADSVYEITISSVTRPDKNGAIFNMTDVIAFDGDFIFVVLDGVIFKLFATDRKIEAKGSR